MKNYKQEMMSSISKDLKVQPKPVIGDIELQLLQDAYEGIFNLEYRNADKGDGTDLLHMVSGLIGLGISKVGFKMQEDDNDNIIGWNDEGSGMYVARVNTDMVDMLVIGNTETGGLEYGVNKPKSVNVPVKKNNKYKSFVPFDEGEVRILFDIREGILKRCVCDILGVEPGSESPSYMEVFSTDNILGQWETVEDVFYELVTKLNEFINVGGN